MGYHAESKTLQGGSNASLALFSQRVLDWTGLPAVWRRSRSGRRPAVWSASLGVALFIWSCGLRPEQLLLVPALVTASGLTYLLWQARR